MRNLAKRHSSLTDAQLEELCLSTLDSIARHGGSRTSHAMNELWIDVFLSSPKRRALAEELGEVHLWQVAEVA